MGDSDWKADVYHRISEPQFRWGLKVLERVSVAGSETVIDAGCGTGRLTAVLVERLPEGRVIALDVSPNMLEKAKVELARFGDRVRFVHADLERLGLDARANGVFSTATFHWVVDHDALFRGLARALVPGGFLEAQCGGAGNLERLHQRAFELMRRSDYAEYYRNWNPWNFATPELTRERLDRAGFRDIETWLEPEPTPFPDRESFERFVSTVVLRLHLAQLPEPLRAPFVSELTDLEAKDDPPFCLEYVRLNMSAKRA